MASSHVEQTPAPDPELPRRRTRLPREERERQILAAAKIVMGKKGYQQASVAEIARQAGVAEGALYNFYRSKKEILEAVICDWYDATLRDYEQACAQISDIQDRLRFAIAHNLDCLCDDIQLSAMYLELRRDPSFRSSRLLEYNKRYIGIMKSIIRAAQSASRRPDPVKPSLIAEMIYSMVETKSETYRTGALHIDRQRIVDEIYALTQRLI